MKIDIKICDNCQKLKNIVLQVEELNLCQNCKDEFEKINIQKIENKKSLINFLIKEKVCDKCNLRESELNEFGKMGCERCYEIFTEFLEKNVYPYHKSKEHIGKKPKNLQDPKEQLKVLKLRYAKALEMEHYEILKDLKSKINCLIQKISLDQ